MTALFRVLSAIVEANRGVRPDVRIRRQRRPLRRLLRELPLDWLFERNKLPGALMSIALALSVASGGILGLNLGTILFLNWTVSVAPAVALAARTVYHRWIDGYWDPTWWTRPQSHQKQEVLEAPENPLELTVDPEQLPVVPRTILRFEHRLIEIAERRPRGDGTRTQQRTDSALIWSAGQMDDWLNQRARTPGFVVSVSLLAVGYFVVSLPFTVIFPINLVVTGIPTFIALYMYARTGDMYRVTRPGVHQRPRRVAVMREHLGLDGGPDMRVPDARSVEPSEAAIYAMRRPRLSRVGIRSAAVGKSRRLRLVRPTPKLPERSL